MLIDAVNQLHFSQIKNLWEVGINFLRVQQFLRDDSSRRMNEKHAKNQIENIIIQN